MNTTNQQPNINDLVAGMLAGATRTNGKRALTQEQATLLVQGHISAKEDHDKPHHWHKQSIQFHADLPDSDVSIYPHVPIQPMTASTVALTTIDQAESLSNPSHQHTTQEILQSVSPLLNSKHQEHELCEATPQPMLKLVLQASAFFRRSLISFFTKSN